MRVLNFKSDRLIGFLPAVIIAALFQNCGKMKKVEISQSILLNSSHSQQSTSQTHAYIEDDKGLFYVDDPTISPDPHQYNSCRIEQNGQFLAGTSLYDTLSVQNMTQNKFYVTDFGAYGTGTSHPLQSSSTSPSCPLQSCDPHFQQTIQDLKNSLNLTRINYPETSRGGNTRYISFTSGFWTDDEWDWVAIQSALVAAHNAGGGTVYIPDTGKDYLLSRSLWIFSNTQLVWLTNTNLQTHSYIRMIKPSYNAGSVIANYNPYDRFNYGTGIAARARSFRCKVYIRNPRVKAMVGENGLAFAKGVYDVRISGGHIHGAKWGAESDFLAGFNEQGGRAVQFEAGVQKAFVYDLKVTDSTIGFSNSAGLYYTLRGDHSRFLNAADQISISQVDITQTEVPFLFSHLAHFRFGTSLENYVLDIAPMSVYVANIKITDSGRLKTVMKSFYINRGIAGHSGIFNFLGGTNIHIYSTSSLGNTVSNSSSYGMISSLIRGFGKNISVKNIKVQARINSLLDFYTPLSNLYSRTNLANLDITNIQLLDQVNYLALYPAENLTQFRGSNFHLTDVQFSKSLQGYLIGHYSARPTLEKKALTPLLNQVYEVGNLLTLP